MAAMEATRRPRATTRSPRESQGTASLGSQDVVARRVAVTQTYFDEAKGFVSSALSADEAGSRMDALDLYNSSLSLLRAGLASLESSAREGLVNAQWRDLKSKMEKMVKSVKSRMETLLEREIEDREKTRTSQSSQTGSVTSQTRSSGSRVETTADLLFNVDTDIALFEVDQKDHVRRYEDVDALSVFQYKSPPPGQPPAFIQVGGFVYPLVGGASPVLKSCDRMYMFPDLRGEDGTVLGVVLDGASEEEIAEFDSVLLELSSLKENSEQVQRQEVGVASTGGQEVGVASSEQWGETVSKSIDRGVTWVSVKISQGTEAAGSLITKGANKLRGKVEPNPAPSEVPPALATGLHYTSKATGVVVGVSDYLMLSLARLTVKVGRVTADAVAGTELVKGTDVHPQAKEAWKVTKTTVKGAAAVFVDLERGAVAIIKDLGRETSKTVSHKYGDQAGHVTQDSLTAAGHTAKLAHTYWSWKTWGIHFVGKVSQVITSDSQSKEDKK